MTPTRTQVAQELIKGCNNYLYDDDFEDDNDLFDHEVLCGTKLIRNNKLELCYLCKAKISQAKDDWTNELEFLRDYKIMVTREGCSCIKCRDYLNKINDLTNALKILGDVK